MAQGLAYVWLFLQALRVSALGVACRVWRQIYVKYTSWPYRLVLLTDPCPSLVRSTATGLVASFGCCLGRIGRKIRECTRVGEDPATAENILVCTKLLCLAGLVLDGTGREYV